MGVSVCVCVRERVGGLLSFCSPPLPWRSSRDVDVVRTFNSGRAWGSVFCEKGMKVVGEERILERRRRRALLSLRPNFGP